MFNLRHCMAVIGATSLLSFASLGLCGDDAQDAVSLEKSLPQLVAAGDYRSASRTAFRIASARRSLGDNAAACVALSQSLEYYRTAVARESGLSEPAASALTDNSDAMAQIRARFGCSAS